MNPYPPWICTAWLAQAVATSEACSFAIDAYGAELFPASIAHAARHVIRRASLNWVAWNAAIGLPNWRRWEEYESEASRHAWATPTASAAMAIRPPSRI